MKLEKIIESKKITTLFQPIVSIEKKSTIGYEALSRAYDSENGNLILPEVLFLEAKKTNCLVELDSVCREVAINKYVKLNSYGKLLFINFNVGELNNGIEGKNKIKESLIDFTLLLKKNKIPCSNIVIEIIESNVSRMEDLEYFKDLCKLNGFIIALDDVGSGHSNLNRISLIKPDIIKIDRYLISDIDKNYHKQEVFKAITSLARKIGALIIAEGVERREEALFSMEYRANMIQGFYFSKPLERLDNSENKKMNVISDFFKSYFEKKTTQKKIEIKKFKKIINEICSNFSFFKNEELLRSYLIDFPYIECIYLMDSKGFQSSETIMRDNCIQQKLSDNLFKPAENGTDHSLKQYFYQLKISENPFFLTELYISMATGNKCMTFSKIIEDGNVLAIDVNYERFQDINTLSN